MGGEGGGNERPAPASPPRGGQRVFFQEGRRRRLYALTALARPVADEVGEVVVRLEDEDGVAEALETDGAGGALGDPHVPPPGLQGGLLRLLFLGPWRVLILDASGGGR